MSRTPRLLALALLVAGSAGAVVVESSPVTAGVPASDWCGDRVAPCIVSVAHDGSPVAQTDPLFQVTLIEFEPGHDVQWNLMQGGLYELGPEAAGEWTVVLNTGPPSCRASPTGTAGTARWPVPSPTDYTVAMTAEPTLVTEGCEITRTRGRAPPPRRPGGLGHRAAARRHFWEDPD